MIRSNNDIAYFLSIVKDLFVLIRSNINSLYVIDVINIVKKYMENYMVTNKINIELFMNEIISLDCLDEEDKYTIKYFLIYAREKKIRTNNIKEVRIYIPIICFCIEEVIKYLKNNEKEKAYDLIDTIHFLPEALLSKKRWDPEAYWSDHIVSYREKWDNVFLVREQKDIFKNYK